MQKRNTRITIHIYFLGLNDSSFSDGIINDFDISVIATSNAILNNFDKNSSTTSLSLYISLYVYQAVRSKKLIDLLYYFGYGCSYDEIRKLLTSLASHALVKGDDGVFIPHGITPVNPEEKNYIHASIDNFDQNEDTLDGKNSTHSLAMVIFQNKNNTFLEHKLDHLSKRSLTNLDSFDIHESRNINVKKTNKTS